MQLKSIALGFVGCLAITGAASALPVANLDGAVSSPIEKTQFYGGGGCFYPDGWHGPGFYRCGFRYRRGLGFLGVGRGGFGGRGFGGRGGGRGFGGGHGFAGGHGGGHGGGGHGGGHR